MKIKYINKECKHHGETKHILENRGYYRCTKCRSQNVSNKRRALKLQALEYKGGKCEKCGYNKCVRALEFHHINPKEKDFQIGFGNTWSWKTIQKELDKCILVCSNCHAEIHEDFDK